VPETVFAMRSRTAVNCRDAAHGGVADDLLYIIGDGGRHRTECRDRMTAPRRSEAAPNNQALTCPARPQWLALAVGFQRSRCSIVVVRVPGHDEESPPCLFSTIVIANGCGDRLITARAATA
jgi:hypothetical protein